MTTPAIITSPRTITEIRPQPGPQEAFLRTSADIAIYGGAAGGGKSYALLMEPLRHINVKGFGATIFRRTHPEITQEGGLWDTAEELYGGMGARSNEGKASWYPPGQGDIRIKFGHMQYDKTRINFQGAQIPFIGFDELTHFTWKQFTYMFSRNRSMCGVRPYIRATCNPDPDHFLRTLLDWWIDDETGFAIPERGGVIRWMLVIGNEVMWASSWEELVQQFGCVHNLEAIRPFMEFRSSSLPGEGLCPKCGMPRVFPKSFTFIPSSIYDNKLLLSQDPGYLANLHALPLVDRERLLQGNWNMRETAGSWFKPEWFRVVDAAPRMVRSIRYWDRAATPPVSEQAINPFDSGGDVRSMETAKKKKKGSHTAGVLMGITEDNYLVIPDVAYFMGSPRMVKTMISNLATQDYIPNNPKAPSYAVGLEQDPGQAGKVEVEMLARELHGHEVWINKVIESKGQRAKGFSSQCEAGNVLLVRGKWNAPYINELCNFDGTPATPSDRTDASSGAHLYLSGASGPEVGAWGRPKIKNIVMNLDLRGG